MTSKDRRYVLLVLMIGESLRGDLVYNIPQADNPAGLRPRDVSYLIR